MELAVVETLDELDRLRTYWERVQWHPNIDFAQFRLVCEGRREVLRPYVVVLGSIERPLGLFIARLERRGLAPQLGYFTAFAIPATVLTVVYQGFPNNAVESDAAAVLRHIWGFLCKGGADAVEFNHIAEGSPLLQAFVASAPILWAQKTAAWSEHWSLNVPIEVGELPRRMRSKHRKWHEKKERQLQERFPGSVRWRWLRTFDDIPRLCAQLEAVAARTYQRALGAGFRNAEEHRRRLALFAERNQLRLKVLEIDGTIRAFWFGAVYNDVFHSFATAYDPDLRAYEPGNLLFLRLVDELALEGVKKLDFGLGDAFYKKRFGDASWRETTVRLFAPSPKGLLLRIFVWVCDTVDAIGRRLLRSTGLTDRIKTFWRRRIES